MTIGFAPGAMRGSRKTAKANTAAIFKIPRSFAR
jgi:hypothetical protein